MLLFEEYHHIWGVHLEGAAEDMITSSLKKSQASQEEINLFLQREGGKLVYKPEHVPTLFKWIKSENANTRELPDDYKNYLKYFPNVKLDQFKSYVDWTERVHGKRDEAGYHSRHKDIGDIEIEGVDKENVLADDENVLILKGDDEHKCVRYGKGYSFCISRAGGGNMYGTYRLAKSSTFYFVFFKKIPKEDERHIMVLDRTRDGWEWTFGKNQTRVIRGGWKEIVQTFPVLKKYEKIFVNKPLTDEEKEYQRKLKEFVESPSLDEFNKFTYQQKADVLKFGMLIPLNIFEKLDKYLRNEWVSVGPKMSDDIYKELTSSEKDRFTKVRAQQLTQREIEDIYDVEICKNDPELFDKHLKADKELSEKEERKINSKIKDGVFNGDLSIASKYFFPNLDNLKIVNGDIDADSATSISLPQLQQSRYIYAPSATSISLPQLQQSGGINAESATSISLPQLQQSGGINASSVTSLSLPQLQQSEGINASSVTSLSLPQLQQSKDINAPSVTSISLPQLQKSGYINARSATSISLPQLQKSGYINARSATSISLPQLQQSVDIYAPSATSLSLPQLQKSGGIYAMSVTSISLPQLQQSGDITATSATSISLPQLQQSGDITALSAKKIKISSNLVAKINKPKDCKIIEPDSTEELNDSVVCDLLKKFLLKT